jgi:acyl-CoA reductase-like NAD-dependent aldehyde dehydrogenase
VKTPITRPATTSQAAVDAAILRLRQGAASLVRATLAQRSWWARSCIEGVGSVAVDWVEAACRAKQIPAASPACAEEVLVGPVAVLRYLRLLIATFADLESYGVPRLPKPADLRRDQLRVPVFPTRQLYDRLVFRPLHAETWLQPHVARDAIFGDYPARLTRQATPPPRVAVVLGAGNVSSIPATDVLTKILQDDCAVLLKMNPVNDYLGPIFEQALRPLIDEGLLQIVYGGADVGTYAVHHSQIDSMHLTGSIETHDAIVWGTNGEAQRTRKANGSPVVTKPVTSELGNVTPWLILPGDYSEKQLHFQAENIAASITNNASFNCIATKMLITWKGWPARGRFLDLIESILSRVPPRCAYYPGAKDRFLQFAGRETGATDGETLPWTLRRGVDADREPELFERESFVCVTGETAIDATSPQSFLEVATEFMNDRLWGTLAAAITVPNAWRKRDPLALDAALERLRFGTIGINVWPGIAYALMSPPWGPFPGSTLSDVQSGSGFVHNTYLLGNPQKTVLRSPLSFSPKPAWFSTHRRPEFVATKLCDLYSAPSLGKIPGLVLDALRG